MKPSEIQGRFSFLQLFLQGDTTDTAVSIFNKIKTINKMCNLLNQWRKDVSGAISRASVVHACETLVAYRTGRRVCIVVRGPVRNVGPVFGTIAPE